VHAAGAGDDDDSGCVLVETSQDARTRVAPFRTCQSTAFSSVPDSCLYDGCTTTPAGLLMAMNASSS
jgi:hypothetical protein